MSKRPAAEHLQQARQIDMMNIVQNLAIVLTKMDEMSTRIRDLSDHMTNRVDDHEGRLRTIESDYVPKSVVNHLTERVNENNLSIVKTVAYCTGAAAAVAFIVSILLNA